MTDSAVARYEAMLRERGISELCWAVVEGVDRPVDVEDAVRRLGGDPAALTEMSPSGWPADLSFRTLVFLAPYRSGVLIAERGTPQSVRSEVMRSLSEGARVHSTAWHFNGGERLVYGVFGTVLTGLIPTHPSFPRNRWGQRPDALDEDLRAVGGFAVDDPDYGPGPEADARAIALATIERRTGARLSSRWLDGTHAAVVLNDPIPDDPRPATTFGRVDPDLDAWVRLAPPGTRRAVVRHALRAVVERYDLADDPVVSLLLPAVERGEAMLPGPELDAVREAWRQVPSWVPASPGSPEARRRQARHAVYASLGPRGPVAHPLDELGPVKEVLGDQWPSLRADLLAIARDTG